MLGRCSFERRWTALIEGDEDVLWSREESELKKKLGRRVSWRHLWLASVQTSQKQPVYVFLFHSDEEMCEAVEGPFVAHYHSCTSDEYRRSSHSAVISAHACGSEKNTIFTIFKSTLYHSVAIRCVVRDFGKRITVVTHSWLRSLAWDETMAENIRNTSGVTMMLQLDLVWNAIRYRASHQPKDPRITEVYSGWLTFFLWFVVYWCQRMSRMIHEM